MRHPLPAILLFMVLVYGDLSAQDRDKITDKSGTKYSRIDEVYYVVKGDKTVRDGPYQLLRNDKILVSGYYDHGQKDSIWEAYSPNGILVSRKWYAKGQRTGQWHFFNYKGEAEWSYDFATGKASVQVLAHPFSDTSSSYYRSDAGAWVQGPPDKPLQALSSSGEWLNFLNRTLRYPDEAVNNELMGDVMIGITVDEQGTITDYEVVKTAAPSLDAEALRVVKLYPFEFIPAERDGKKIKAQFRVPIRFKLEVAK